MCVYVYVCICIHINGKNKYWAHATGELLLRIRCIIFRIPCITIQKTLYRVTGTCVCECACVCV